jgi:murein DD-endopeptidase MepM/ murein hydrolase activator NlpD
MTNKNAKLMFNVTMVILAVLCILTYLHSARPILIRPFDITKYHIHATRVFHEITDGEQHAGVDYSLRPDSEIIAPCDGKIIKSRWWGGYGNAIIIDGGWVTYKAKPARLTVILGHLNEYKALLGSEVSQGELIALSGSTGKSTGPHIHFEARIDDIPIRPGELR